MYSLLDSVVCGTRPCTLKKLKLLSRSRFDLGFGEFDLLEVGGIDGSAFSVLVVFAGVGLLTHGCM